MSEVKIWALPGFLGLPSDWNALKTEVEGLKIGKAVSMRSWAEQFNREMETEGAGYKNILLGYSMGGGCFYRRLWKILTYGTELCLSPPIPAT